MTFIPDKKQTDTRYPVLHPKLLFPSRRLKVDTHEGFCSRSMVQDDFARVSTHGGALFAPGACNFCSQVFNRLNIVEYFAGWKFCSRGWSIPMKSLVHTEELCSWSVPLELAPGAKPLVCIGLKEEVLTWMVNGANLGYLGSVSKEKMHCSEENLEVFGLPALNI